MIDIAMRGKSVYECTENIDEISFTLDAGNE